MSKVNTEDSPTYNNETIKLENQLIESALATLESRLVVKGDFMQNPETVKTFLKLKMTNLEHEVFGVLFLDTQHQLIQYDEMFRGTINGASVHPREVAKQALKVNAAAVIFAHNHPSGLPEPSTADRHITKQLKDALTLFDITVLDHIIIGGVDSTSFSERGYL